MAAQILLKADQEYTDPASTQEELLLPLHLLGETSYHLSCGITQLLPGELLAFQIEPKSDPQLHCLK